MAIPAGVISKTEKGIEEIRTRAYKLPQKQRALLILIDGKLTADEMAIRFSSIGDIRPTLQLLLDQGFAEVSGVREGSGTMRPGGRAETSAAAPPAGLVEAARALSRTLYDMIGPPADTVAARLERARDRESFEQAATAAASMIESFGGRKKADAFRAQADATARMFGDS